jgi:chaperonin GroES
MSIRPLNNKVLVAENAMERKTESGIILDGVSSIQETSQATVLAIGPKVTDVKVGDVVLIEWNKATIVTIDGNQRAMIDAENIMVVLDSVA